MRRLVLLAVFAAMLALASTPIASAAPKTLRGCNPAGSRTLAQNAVTRVFQIRFRQAGRTQLARYGCRRSTGRAFLLGLDDCVTAGGSEGDNGAVNPRLAGRYLAYEEAWCNDFFFWDRLKVIDMRTGRLYRSIKPLARATDPQVVRFVLTTRGSVAWTATGLVEFDTDRNNEDRSRVGKADGAAGRPVTVLDESVDGAEGVEGEIDTKSLELSRDGRHVTWSRGGQQRSARIR